MNSKITLTELFEAYFDCRCNKRNTINALRFEADYEQNLIALCSEINRGTYQIGSSIAFIVDYPVKREIFAADFRDRIVHHLVINKLNALFEKIFIYDSYACRTGKGSHFGIKRADGFIRKCSQNYTKDCYVLKFDIQAFFMHIDKRVLLRRLTQFIQDNYIYHDKALLLSLCHQIISNDPTGHCIRKTSKKHWQGLPLDKSLFYTPSHCGLPIGNLTSQIFANFYMNVFDHFMKHDLNLRYYGRYVDDALVVHEDKLYLQLLIPRIKKFLKDRLRLTLHPKKLYLQHYAKGVQFLGAVIRPNRIYIANRIKGNFYESIMHHNEIAKVHKPSKEEQVAFLCSINSYLGIMKHYNTHRLRKKMLIKHVSIWWWNLVYCSGGCAKVVFKQKKRCSEVIRVKYQ